MPQSKHPKPASGDKSPANPAISKIKKLYFSDSMDTVKQGLQIIETLQDHEIYEYLLKDIDYPDDLSLSFKVESAVWKSFIDEKKIKKTTVNTMILALLNTAPADLNVPLVRRRDEVRLIDFNAVDEILGELNFPNLREAVLYSTPIETLDSLQKLTLSRLFIQDAPELRDLAGILPMTTLETLELSVMPLVTEIVIPESFKNFKLFNIHQCRKLTALKILSPTVKKIDISGCRSLKMLDLTHCNNLQSLTVSNCDQLTTLGGLAGRNFSHFSLNRCRELAVLGGIENSVIQSGKISYLKKISRNVFERFGNIEWIE